MLLRFKRKLQLYYQFRKLKVLPIQEIKGKKSKDWYLEREVKILVKTVGILGRKKSFQGSNKTRKDLRREGNLKVKKKGLEPQSLRELVEKKHTGDR